MDRAPDFHSAVFLDGSARDESGTLPISPHPPHSMSVDREPPQQHVRSRKPRRERKAACTACKQQKLKCDAHVDPNKPCSRCSKLSLSCFQSLGFQRLEVRKSQKKAIFDDNSIIRNETQQNGQNVGRSVPSGTAGETYNTPNEVSVYVNHAEIPLSDNYGSGSNILAPDGSGMALPISTPKSRSLSDIHVDGKIIDECFQLFLTSYSPYLPIFAMQLKPDDCYKSSLTLFWAIVVVGSRSLISDPTLLRSLSPEVINLALTSFQSRRNQIDDIKGLLILCTWPCPLTSLLRDNTVALSGLLYNLSMQAGLHVSSSHFALLNVPEAGHLSRQVELASLWAHVVITCQSTMSLGGYPSLVCFNNMACLSFEKTSWQFVPSYLKLRYKIQAMLSEFESIIVELCLDVCAISKQDTLSIRIETFVDQLEKYAAEFSSVEGSTLDAIYVKIARLQLEVLHFHCNADANNRNGLAQLFSTASSLITSIKNFDDITSIVSFWPSYLGTSLSLAAFTLLRMMKSGFATTLEPAMMEKGKSSLFASIHILKQLSLINNDIYAKAAEFLSVMWSNPSLFKPSDPTSWWTLRVRNRLSMSVIFDTIFIWVEEYGACTYAATAPLRRPHGQETGETDEECRERPLSFPCDDRWLYELDWNTSLDALLMEPVISSGG